MNDMSAHDLLRLCLSSTWSEQAQQETNNKLVDGEIDWDGFLRQCEDQACSPLVYQTLHGSAGIPIDVEKKLEKSFINCGSANLIYFHELEKILNRFEAIDLHPILLKGAALVLTLYENIALRPMLDIDLLIRQKDIAIASQIFLELDYSQARLEPQIFLRSYENEVGFSKQGAIDFLFELHWSLFDSPYYQSRLPIEWFWQNLQPVKLHPTNAFILAPEAQLLHLCGHLQLHHSGKELLWLNDIALLLVKYEREIDWDETIAKAQKFNLVLPLKHTIQNLVSDWYIPVARDILERIDQLVPSGGEKQIYTRLTRHDRPVGLRLWDDLNSMPTLWQKIRFTWINIFPSIGYMIKHYQIKHPFLIPFYYFYRWYLGLSNLFKNN